MISNELSVVMVIQTFYPQIGGAEKQCLILSKFLQKRGVRIEVLIERLKGFSATDTIEGIHVNRLGWGGDRLWHSISFMFSILIYLIKHRKNYQVIHVHLAASHAVAAALAGKILKKKVIVLIGGGNEVGEFTLSRKKFIGKFKLIALGLLKPHFVILNDRQREQFQGYNLDQAPISLIPNGVETDIYHPVGPEQRKKIREKFNWHGLVFLYTGRFNPGKITVETLKSFLEGWSHAIQNRKDVFFKLVGWGPLENDYRMLINQMGLQESVALMPATDDVYELYQGADIFVLPSLSEGLSNSMLEALASHLPIMASRVAGNIELIEEGVNGFLFDPSSSQDVEKTICAILDRKDQLSAMGKNSGVKSESYSIDLAAQRYIDLYRAP